MSTTQGSVPINEEYIKHIMANPHTKTLSAIFREKTERERARGANGGKSDLHDEHQDSSIANHSSPDTKNIDTCPDSNIPSAYTPSTATSSPLSEAYRVPDLNNFPTAHGETPNGAYREPYHPPTDDHIDYGSNDELAQNFSRRLADPSDGDGHIRSLDDPHDLNQPSSHYSVVTVRPRFSEVRDNSSQGLRREGMGRRNAVAQVPPIQKMESHIEGSSEDRPGRVHVREDWNTTATSSNPYPHHTPTRLGADPGNDMSAPDTVIGDKYQPSHNPVGTECSECPSSQRRPRDWRSGCALLAGINRRLVGYNQEWAEAYDDRTRRIQTLQSEIDLLRAREQALKTTQKALENSLACSDINYEVLSLALAAKEAENATLKEQLFNATESATWSRLNSHRANVDLANSQGINPTEIPAFNPALERHKTSRSNLTMRPTTMNMQHTNMQPTMGMESNMGMPPNL